MRRHNSFNPTQLRHEMDRLVGDFFGPVASAVAPHINALAHGFPPLNAWEKGEDVFVEAEVPGLKSEDVEISVVGHDLTIHGRRGQEPLEGATYHRRERSTGEFNRVVRLPIEVDASKVEATLKDGVLLIRLPKAESAKPRKIKVTAE